MRLVSGGVQHETNTFAVTPTELEDFVRDSDCGSELAGGEVIRERLGGTGTIHGGYLAGAREAGVELMPLLCARAQPSGIVSQTGFREILDRFLSRLAAIDNVDGLLLDLHGAMVTDEHADAEGAFLAAVRQQVGPDLPIVVTLDLHANISRQMAELADVIIGFDTYPHVDMYERGVEAAHLLTGIVRQKVRPVQAWRQLPLITLPPMQCTLREPMQTLINRLHELEREPRVLTATVAMGFPFADVPDAGVSVLVTTDNDPHLAAQKADELASRLWDLRDALQPRLTTIEEAIAHVAAHPESPPVIFADGSDNPGGGAPCDGTVALQALLTANMEGSVVAVLFDPETAAQAHAAGTGKTIRVRLGGKTDDRHGPPVETDAVVETLTDGRFVYGGPMMNGVEDCLGPTAVLRLGEVVVVVSSIRRQCLDRQMLLHAGVDPAAQRLLVLKSAVHFRADFGGLAETIFDADTPGIHRPDFDGYDYKHLRRPVYPLDPDATWSPA